jgi:hypothetical protein
MRRGIEWVLQMGAKLSGQNLRLIKACADRHHRAPAKGEATPTAGQFAKAQHPRQHGAAPFKRARIQPFGQQQRMDRKGFRLGH